MGARAGPVGRGEGSMDYLRTHSSVTRYNSPSVLAPHSTRIGVPNLCSAKGLPEGPNYVVL